MKARFLRSGKTKEVERITDDGFVVFKDKTITHLINVIILEESADEKHKI